MTMQDEVSVQVVQEWTTLKTFDKTVEKSVSRSKRGVVYLPELPLYVMEDSLQEDML